MAKIERRPVSGLRHTSDVKTGDFYERIADGAVFLAVAMLVTDGEGRGSGRHARYVTWYQRRPDSSAQFLVSIDSGALCVLEEEGRDPLRTVGQSVYESFGLKDSALPEGFVVRPSELRPIAGRVLIDPSPRLTLPPSEPVDATFEEEQLPAGAEAGELPAPALAELGVAAAPKRLKR